jgi:hypothetical protein
MRYLILRSIKTGKNKIHLSRTISEYILHTLCGRNLAEYEEVSQDEYRELIKDDAYPVCEGCLRQYEYRSD